jgi:hypothetical protein
VTEGIDVPDRRGRVGLDQAGRDLTGNLRETYHRGNSATILLHDAERGTVLLPRQFRYPARCRW